MYSQRRMNIFRCSPFAEIIEIKIYPLGLQSENVSFLLSFQQQTSIRPPYIVNFQSLSPSWASDPFLRLPFQPSLSPSPIALPGVAVKLVKKLSWQQSAFTKLKLLILLKKANYNYLDLLPQLCTQKTLQEVLLWFCDFFLSKFSTNYMCSCKSIKEVLQ